MTPASSDPAVLDVPEFIRTCVERAGGAVEARQPGRLDVLLPPALETAAGGRSWVSLALETDALGADAEPAMLGSPFMDALIAHAGGRGTVACGYLPAGRMKRKGLREEAERTLRFSHCRTRYQEDEAEVLLAATAEFDFKVAFLSEERRERLYVVPVNLFSNQVDLALAARLTDLPIDPEPVLDLPRAASVSVGSAYETAGRALRGLVGEEAARQQVRVGQRFAVEFARIHDYYAQIIEELERRRVRERSRAARGWSANDRSGVDQVPLFDALAHKLDAVGRERERKLQELGETYAIRTRARLASVRCLWQPKLFFKVHLDRGSVTRTLALAYDPLLERLEPPTCDSCRQAATRLRVSATARLLCPACAAE